MRDEKKEAAQKERKIEGNGKVDVTLDYQSYNPLDGLRYGVCLYVREAREAGWFSSPRTSQAAMRPSVRL